MALLEVGREQVPAVLSQGLQTRQVLHLLQPCCCLHHSVPGSLGH